MRTQSSPRIVILRATPSVDIDTRLKNTARQFADAGFKVRVVYFHNEKELELVNKSGIEWLAVPLHNIFRSGGTAKYTRKKISRNPFHKSSTELAMDRELQSAKIEELLVTLKKNDLNRVSKTPLILKLAIAKNRRNKLIQVTKKRKREEKRERRQRRNGTTNVDWRFELPTYLDFETSVAKYVDEFHPDVIYSFDSIPLRAGVNAAKRAEANGRDVTLVADILENYGGIPLVGMVTPRYIEANVLYEREYLPYYSSAVTVNEHVKNALAQRIPNLPPMAVVQNCPRREDQVASEINLRDELEVAPETPVIVYSGTLNSARGLDVAIKSLVYAPEFVLGIVAVPYPHYMEDELLDLAKELGVDDRVKFAQPVEANQIISYLSDADIGLLPLSTDFQNHVESTPNKLFEYMHAGIPIVSSEIIDVSEFVSDTGFGAIFPYPDAEACAAAYKSVHQRLKSGEISPPSEEVLTRYSWESQGSKLIALTEGGSSLDE